MNVLDLFAGGGGGCLGGRLLGWKSIGYVEWERGAQKILLARIRDGLLDDAPIWSDARSFASSNVAARRFIRAIRGRVGLTAGFPCQPFSCAGKRLGEDDPRNMWPATARIIGEVRPRFALLENVPGLLNSGYFGRVLGDLHEIGYDAIWDVFSAAGVGAPHRRERLWVLAYPKCSERWPRDTGGCNLDGQKRVHADGKELPSGSRTGRKIRNAAIAGLPQRAGEAMGESGTQPQSERSVRDVPNTASERMEGHGPDGQQVADEDEGEEIPVRRGRGWWTTEPRVGRVAHGVPARVDRLKALGNGQVPKVVVRAWRELNKKLKFLLANADE